MKVLTIFLDLKFDIFPKNQDLGFSYIQEGECQTSNQEKSGKIHF